MFSRLIRSWAKKPSREYPALRELLVIFFSSEHDDFGNTIEEIVENYRDYGMPYRQAEQEVSKLLLITDDNELAFIMQKLVDNRFRPQAWDKSWRDFLKKIQGLLLTK